MSKCEKNREKGCPINDKRNYAPPLLSCHSLDPLMIAKLSNIFPLLLPAIRHYRRPCRTRLWLGGTWLSV